MVPSARLRQETAAKREAQKKLRELEAEVSRLQELEQTVETERASWQEERALLQAGITDDEAISVVRHLYGRLEERGRPSLADWVRAQVEAPDQAPRALQPYLPQQQSTRASTRIMGGGESGGARRTMGARRDTSGGSGGPPSGAKLSREQASSRLAKLAETATRTGDWTAYDRERPDLLEVISGG